MWDDEPEGDEDYGVVSPIVRRVFEHEPTARVANKVGLPSRDVINLKAAVALKLLDERLSAGRPFDVKAGIIREESAVGRAGQALGSLLLPGDTTPFTNPRSAVFSAISPGGGGGFGRIGRGGGVPGVLSVARRAARSQLRCPAGYENGGRFAVRGFGNCGRILFELPNRRLTGLVALNKPFLKSPPSEAMLRALGGGPLTGSTIQIQRNAQIPRIAGPSRGRVQKAFDGIVSVIQKNPEARFMVRRDGFILAPAVSSSFLAGVRKSPDMEGASFFAGTKSPSNIGVEHAPLIWQNKVRSLNNVLPGGGTTTLEATRELSNGDRRRLGRLWATTASGESNQFDGGDRLREIASLSEGALAYRENIPDVDDANDLVTATRNRESVQVRRWVFQKFMAANAPGRNKNEAPWKAERVARQSADTAPEKTISSLEEAISHLNGGGSLADVPAKFLSQALAKSDKFKKVRGKDKTTIFDGGRGNRWISAPALDDFEHVSRRVSSDMQSYLGLKAGRVFPDGEGEMRGSVFEDRANIVDGAFDKDPLLRPNPKDLFTLAISDYLLDNRGRTEQNLATVKVGNRRTTFSTSDALAAGVGLSADELRQRRVQILGAWYDRDGGAYKEAFTDVSARQKQILLGIYNDTIRKAEEFKWEEYIKRITADGKLTKPEQVRLDLMRDIFERRLATLRSSKTRLFEFVGLT
jgi:hypothetical protein